MSVSNAIEQFRKTLPSISDARETISNEFRTAPNPNMVLIHANMYATLITLHQINAGVQEEEHALCVGFAHSMAEDARLVGDLSMLRAHICLGVSLPFFHKLNVVESESPIRKA